MSIGLLGQKIGMTSVYDAKGRMCPVTVIAAGDNVLLRRLTEKNEGYSALQAGFGAQKESRVTKPLLGEFKKAGVEPQKFVREFRLTHGRIWKNMGMPGHLGDERVTVQNLQVMQVRETEKVILISGAVPGANGSFVVIRPALKKTGGESAAATVAATPSSQKEAAK